MVRLVEALSPEDIALARSLFREYQGAIGVDLCFQSFEEELRTLPGRYAPPRGRLLLAFDGDEPVGCGALRSIADGICELKRMWIRPRSAGAVTPSGVGEAASL